MYFTYKQTRTNAKSEWRVPAALIALCLLATNSNAADFGIFLENARTLQAEKHDPIYWDATFQVDVVVEFVDRKGKVTDMQRSVEKVTYTAGTFSSGR